MKLHFNNIHKNCLETIKDNVLTNETSANQRAIIPQCKFIINKLKAEHMRQVPDILTLNLY